MALLAAMQKTLIGMAMAVGLSAAAVAQETPKLAEPPKPGNAWTLNCASAGEGDKLRCQMSQTLTETKSGQRVLTVTISQHGADVGLGMLLALPHGLYLPAGASYQVDTGEKAVVQIQTSDQNGAYAVVPMTEPLVAALRKGVQLSIGMESAARAPVAIPVSLAGFSTAYDKLLAMN